MFVCTSYCVDFELEYFTDITLPCEQQDPFNGSTVNPRTNRTLKKQVWLLPNGHVKEKDFGIPGVTKNDTMDNDTNSKTFNLTIKHR